MQELVSVIIPTFNRPWCLRNAVRSVFEQTYPHFEVIVVDDGSSVPAADVLIHFRDSRLKVLRHDTNQGISVARNTGIAEAQGPWIALLDDDDTWKPKKLRVQLGYMLRQAAGADASVTEFVGKNSGHVSCSCRRERKIGMAHAILSWIGVGLGSTLLVRRGVFNSVGPFDPAFPRTEDWEWLLRFVLKGKSLVTYPGILTEYSDRNYGDGIFLPKDYTQKVACKHREAIHARVSPKLAKAFEVYVCLRQTNDAIIEGQFFQAATRLAQAVRLDPSETLRNLLGASTIAVGKRVLRRALNGLRCIGG